MFELIDPGKKGINARISSVDLVVTTPTLARDFLKRISLESRGYYLPLPVSFVTNEFTGSLFVQWNRSPSRGSNTQRIDSYLRVG